MELKGIIDIARMVRADHMLVKIYEEIHKFPDIKYDVIFMAYDVAYNLIGCVEIFGMRPFSTHYVEPGSVIMMDSSKFRIEYNEPELIKNNEFSYSVKFDPIYLTPNVE